MTADDIDVPHALVRVLEESPYAKEGPGGE
jgi:hypothetical protein